jgi:chromosome condensin MukBEF complex kleisin-like MukF subunit
VSPTPACLAFKKGAWQRDIMGEVKVQVKLTNSIDLGMHHRGLLPRRRQRHSDEAREIVAQAVRLAEADKAAGLDWDGSFAQLRQVRQDLTARL